MEIKSETVLSRMTNYDREMSGDASNALGKGESDCGLSNSVNGIGNIFGNLTITTREVDPMVDSSELN